MYACMHGWMYVCMYVSMYVCMYVYTYVMVIYGGNINEILMQCNVCMYV